MALVAEVACRLVGVVQWGGGRCGSGGSGFSGAVGKCRMETLACVEAFGVEETAVGLVVFLGQL